MQSKITQLHNLEPQEILNPIEELKQQIKDLKSHFTPKEPIEYLTRSETADLLKINLSTLFLWTKKGMLLSYGIGARVYYKRKEVEKSIIKLNQ
jgi:hypothetical protein